MTGGGWALAERDALATLLCYELACREQATLRQMLRTQLTYKNMNADAVSHRPQQRRLEQASD